MSADRREVVAKLLSTLHETLPFFDEPKDIQERSYADGKWNMRELLAHISDTETVLLDRLRRLAAEDKPVLMAFDQDRWCDNLFYKLRDVDLVKMQYEVARRTVIEMARTLDASLDEKSGTHSESGTRTFAQVLAHIAEHNAHHLEQLKAIAKRRTWMPR
jgi:uncharacterized damage-inducible protein DinB